MSEPKPLNPTEQDALVKQIGLTLMRAVPEGWRQVTAEYRATGRYFELAAEVRSVDGSVHGWAPPQDVAMLFARLRAGMHREGRGSWSNARYQLDHPSSYNLDFDRAEPQWQTPPPQQAYFDEMRFFPRTEDNVPDWLRRRLGPPAPPPQGAQIPQVPQVPQTPPHLVPPPPAPSLAGPSPAAPPLAGPPLAGPPPAGRSFRTARVFDGAGPGGRPSVNRPPVPEAERQPLLDYLDHAPVAVANRGFDADVLHPDLPSVVPVAFQTDGHWIWPAAVGYYLRSYGVPPEAELVERARAAGFRSPEVSEELRVAAAANLGAPPAPQGTPLPQPPVVETPEPAEPEVPEEAEVPDHAPDQLEDEVVGHGPAEQEHVHEPEDAGDEAIELEPIEPEPVEREPIEPEVIRHEVIQHGEAEPEAEIEETVNLVDFQPALAEREEAHHQAGPASDPVEAEPEQLVDFDQSKFDAAQDGPPYRVAFDDDAPTRVNPAVDDRYRRESYVNGMDLFAPQPQQDTQEWSPFEDDHTEIDLEPVVDEVEEESPEEVAEPVAETPSEPAESGRRRLVEHEPEPEPVEDQLVDVSDPFQVDRESQQSDDTTEFEVDQDAFDSDRAAEPERPRQPSPEEERELGNVRRALDDLDVPSAVYRFGEPADRTWGMRTAGDGWEVAWFDHGPNNSVRFERVEDAAAYLIGKLVLTGHRTPRRPQIPPLQAPSLPPRPPRQPDQVNGFRDEGRRPLLPPRPPEQVRPEPVRPEPVRPEPVRPEPLRPEPPRPEATAQDSTDAGKPARGWPIKPLNGEPPLTLFRHKKMIELAPGTEVDRFGDPNGNLAYTVGTPFEERSLVPSWINRPYRVYRLRRPVEVLTGVAVPWFEQPGGGTAYLFPKAIEEMLADGSLVEITQDAHAPR